MLLSSEETSRFTMRPADRVNFGLLNCTGTDPVRARIAVHVAPDVKVTR